MTEDKGVHPIIAFILALTGMILILIFLTKIGMFKEPVNKVCKRCVKTETQLRSHLSWSPIVGWHYKYEQEKTCVKWDVRRK